MIITYQLIFFFFIRCSKKNYVSILLKILQCIIIQTTKDKRKVKNKKSKENYYQNAVMYANQKLLLKHQISVFNNIVGL